MKICLSLGSFSLIKNCKTFSSEVSISISVICGAAWSIEEYFGWMSECNFPVISDLQTQLSLFHLQSTSADLATSLCFLLRCRPYKLTIKRLSIMLQPNEGMNLNRANDK